MNRRQLIFSGLAATAASAIGLKAAPAASVASEDVALLTRYGLVTFPGSGSLFLYGAPGIGKSAITKTIAEERGETCIDLALVESDTLLAFPDDPMIPTKPLTFSARDLMTEVTP